jgi:hypothetical protein
MAPPVFKSFLAYLLVLPVLLGAAPAWAAPEPSPSEISVARRLFDEARVAEDAGRWREAAEKFRSAIAIKDTPGMRFHLARCEEEQGALVEALVEYDRARELLDAGAKAADVEKLLAGARERVRAKVALLTLKLPKDVQNVSVELDGQALSRTVVGQPMPINPGKHKLSAVAVGRSKFVSDVDLGTGEVRQLVVELPPEPITREVPVTLQSTSQPASPTPLPGVAVATKSDTSAPIPTRTLVLVGEGALFAAGLATGIGFTIAKSSANRDYDKAAAAVGDDPRGCSRANANPSCAALLDALHARNDDGTYATIGLVTAGVSAAAFGLTYFLWPNSKASGSLDARASRDGAFVTYRGRF